MSIRVPDDAAIVREPRLTAIGVLAALAEHRVPPLKELVKASIAKKAATFAESDLVLARLKAGGSPMRFVDPGEFLRLYQSKKITRREYLSGLRVSKEPLKAFMTEDEIDGICRSFGTTEPALMTEFKSGVDLDFEKIEAVVLAEVERQTCGPQSRGKRAA